MAYSFISVLICFAFPLTLLRSFTFCLFNGRHTYVDLGTGTGVMPLIGTSLGAGHITGIDINKIIIEMAQRSVEHNHKQDVVTMLLWRLSSYVVSGCTRQGLLMVLL